MMLILVQLFQIYKCILVLCNAILDEPTISHAEEVLPTNHSITFSMTMHYLNLNIKGEGCTRVPHTNEHHR
jgi:hypothetical protein